MCAHLTRYFASLPVSVPSPSTGGTHSPNVLTASGSQSVQNKTYIRSALAAEAVSTGVSAPFSTDSGSRRSLSADQSSGSPLKSLFGAVPAADQGYLSRPSQLSQGRVPAAQGSLRAQPHEFQWMLNSNSARESNMGSLFPPPSTLASSPLNQFGLPNPRAPEFIPRNRGAN